MQILAETRPEWVSPLHLMAVGSAFASLMTVLVKIAGSAGIPAFQMVAARSVILLAVASALLARQRYSPLNSPHKAMLACRGAFGLGAISCLYTAANLLPLADAAIFMFLAPVIVTALGPCILAEQPSRGVVAMPLALVGVVLVAQPPVIFGGSAAPRSTAGVVAGLLSACFSAGARLAVRRLGKADEPVASIVFSMALVSTLGAFIAGPLIPGRPFVRPQSAKTWGCMVGAGLCACMVQLLQTTAMQRINAAPAVAISYVSVLWGMLFDKLLFYHTPNALSLLGAALVCGASLALVHFEGRATAAQAAATDLQRQQLGEAADEGETQPLGVRVGSQGGSQPTRRPSAERVRSGG